MSLFRLEEITVSKKKIKKFTVELRKINLLSGGRLLGLCLRCEHLTKAVCSYRGNIFFPFTSVW